MSTKSSFGGSISKCGKAFCRCAFLIPAVMTEILALISMGASLSFAESFAAAFIVLAADGVIFFELFFGKRKKVPIAAALLTVAGVTLYYALRGELFTPFDPLLVIACHACAALCTVLSYYRPSVPLGAKLVFAFAAPTAAFVMLECLTHCPFGDISAPIFLLNTALFMLFGWTLIFALGRSDVPIMITVLFPLIFGLISYFTVAFRGTPLFPWDLASYGIAATVLGGYDLTIPPSVALVCSAAVLTCTAAATFSFRILLKHSFLIRVISFVLLCAVFILGCAYLQTDRAIEDFDLYPHLFVPHHLYKMNGFAVSFLMNLRYTTVEKPEGYNTDTVQNIAKGFESDSVTDAEVKPNIIVIMNESFADMHTLCDFETNAEYMPFISSLTENTIKGTLHASVVGGNTPNSEFEFLTGMTMGFLPAGSIPYQQFIKSESPTLATQLQSLGYHTVAMHPYWSEGWKRDTVYPLMGFEEMHFLNYDTYGSFNDYPRIRDYISDAGLYCKICETYEENKGSEPLFIFAVTMQNHSGYSDSFDNFTPEIKVKGLEDNFELSTYMSLVRESDAAFEELVGYFSEADEPTVILMFGDHQPNDSIAEPLKQSAGFAYEDSDIKLSERRYTVPYVLWTNYTLDLDAPEEISINYLSSILTEAAELPLTGAQKFALCLCESYPVITGRCLINKARTVLPVSEYPEGQRLDDYSYLQYCYLFDSGNMPKDFWELRK